MQYKKQKKKNHGSGEQASNPFYTSINVSIPDHTGQELKLGLGLEIEVEGFTQSGLTSDPSGLSIENLSLSSTYSSSNHQHRCSRRAAEETRL